MTSSMSLHEPSVSILARTIVSRALTLSIMRINLLQASVRPTLSQVSVDFPHTDLKSSCQNGRVCKFSRKCVESILVQRHRVSLSVWSPANLKESANRQPTEPTHTHTGLCMLCGCYACCCCKNSFVQGGTGVGAFVTLAAYVE